MPKKIPPIYATEEEKTEKLTTKIEEITLREKEEEAYRVSIMTGLPYIDLKNYPIDQRAVIILPKELALETGAAVFYYDREKSLARVGLFVPEDPSIQEKLEKELSRQGIKAEYYVFSESSLMKALRVYDLIVAPKKEKGKVEVRAEELEEAQKEIQNLSELEDKLEKVPVSSVLEIILAGALLGDASDIHLEPEEAAVIMRYRIDGVLNEVAKLSSKVYPKLVSRIKLEAGLKINVTDRPQDGRISVRLRQKEIDLRISILPTAYGETVVIRLLGIGAVSLKLEDLGVRGKALDVLRRQIKKPHGMILVTGPTGSGKTTTLYACLNEIKGSEEKVITLENPIEYHLKGITQTQIEPKKGLTFATALKSVLRQDPDVIMIGEIRDFETADIATQAALTGHIVFSTLHTNDAAGVIPRLIDLGLRPFTIGPSLTVALAQRLVRRLCPKCKEEAALTAEQLTFMKKELGKIFPVASPLKIYRAKGCPFCVKTGYKGRMGVFEVFEVDRDVEALINERASSLEIFEMVVRKQGMVTMLQDGLLRVLEGQTSFDEVTRVLG